MKTLSEDLRKRILYILHYGLVEARNLALAGETEQIHDLTDALEILPGFLDQWKEEHMDMIRFVLRTYQGKYPGRAFDYLAHLEAEEYAPPDRF